MRERANFKRPKLVSNRSIESGADQPVQSIPPAGESYDKFEESQMESQLDLTNSTRGTANCSFGKIEVRKRVWKGLDQFCFLFLVIDCVCILCIGSVNVTGNWASIMIELRMTGKGAMNFDRIPSLLSLLLMAHSLDNEKVECSLG